MSESSASVLAHLASLSGAENKSLGSLCPAPCVKAERCPGQGFGKGRVDLGPQESELLHPMWRLFCPGNVSLSYFHEELQIF